MATISAARREAVKGLLRSIMRAALVATRAIEPEMVWETDAAKPKQMNAICAEWLGFHMWRACKRARGKMKHAAYCEFSDYAAKVLGILAAGCFTGLFDKNAEAIFVAGLQSSFARFEGCEPDAGPVGDVMKSKCALPTAARRIARMAGREDDEEVVMRVMVLGMQSINASGVNDGVDAVARAT